MRKLIVLAALMLGLAMTHQATACDWQREATQAPVVVADCTGQGCTAEAAKPDPDASKATEEPATPAPDKLAGD